ncbi:hypothetical protein BATDEDRAFT_21861 [Batrachochytrium dendrobatidis JAM81]|uniref:Phospholipase/carboxylesterase/thioesterase domain-containing protein n=1 Tax=Batrachochytrium dendrobatidis (strain JAM81 / FGSC 10211) TaxID=684364 RepID=F4NVM2_BATDJ|nr:uncharacterized protein BATDEDRAFT_21861 [Batrachochytrium dendrobatidis JAM81]EGF83299.1 hypothetical protein BATDEDRAFT_21861 [Batrachochytrium dendrobatidis JAM81]|eukprot:XP_006675400.1 hypothetical protein BATDEDRAFT_21861 [Batrachochytrium dendrobatidis JAM81]
MPTLKTITKFAGLKQEFRSSNDKVNSNILILLHGLGDTAANFVQFGVKMQLPQTAICAIAGPSNIPYYDQVLESIQLARSSFLIVIGVTDLDSGCKQLRKGIQSTRSLICSFLTECVIASKEHPDGWPAERVFLLGFSQGGIMALDVALMGSWPDTYTSEMPRALELGGVVSISGWIDMDRYDSSNTSINGRVVKKTSVLVTQGISDGAFDMKLFESKKSVLRRFVETEDQLQVGVIAGKGHTMPQSQVRYDICH